MYQPRWAKSRNIKRCTDVKAMALTVPPISIWPTRANAVCSNASNANITDSRA
eukprot:CAMPEP_0179055886 /NCGR_PEP_ID=MMETSP0796-20121207/23530_1 /TAXON_ID=73915 /ORGANISM="Pyrodinium bahamense, Strain pbaha01" /LENGTH=52 /DNA_ID=CAMNT_0020752549 /DNA_START=276 /DNA_END=434 /DNA_ORIENTATION=+